MSGKNVSGINKNKEEVAPPAPPAPTGFDIELTMKTGDQEFFSHVSAWGSDAVGVVVIDGQARTIFPWHAIVKVSVVEVFG